jgi:hypothetical protein
MHPPQRRKKIMNLGRTALGIAIALVLLGAGTTVASTAPVADGRAEALQEPNPNQHETPIQSVNGKVVAISKTDLTVEVQADGKSDPIDFVIDENTKMDGDIKPGIMATVDYQTKDTKKYATHIMPAEAKKP